MGGKRKRKLVPPNTLVRTPASLPKSRYDFVPRTSSDPPVLPNNQRQPSVRDYPPPKQLFPTPAAPRSGASPPAGEASPPGTTSRSAASQIGGAASAEPQTTPHRPTPHRPTPQSSHSQPPPHRPAAAQSPHNSHSEPPPLRPAASLHSSQAQNSHNTEEDEDVSDVGGLPEPNLSEHRMEALNSLLLAPRPKNITVLDPDLLEPNSTWFGYDKSSLTRKITKCFTNKFDGPFYSWSCVPRERQERYFVEFAKKHRWDPSLTGLVQEHFESIIQLRLKDMVSTARCNDEQPKWINDKLWTDMKTHWSTEEQKSKSATTSAARMSDRKGLGPHKHTSGQKSYRQIEQEMVVELGRPVSFGEVFIGAHTKKDGTFVDLKAKQVVEAYMKKKEEKLSEHDLEPTELSDGRHPVLSIEEDNELFIQSTLTNERGEMFGFGSLKNLLKGKVQNPETSASFRQMQQQLQMAEEKLKEQAALIAQQEAENARVSAAQSAQSAELAIVHKFLQTDARFIAFVAQAASSASVNP
ncbi:putative transposase-like protein [Cardamine amara subsp. amara]|uniref:Transposase-like protein n=1 Tax=Cardamine amara subsp. amara TaxID=228776 RepID=A0ABD1C9D6_CARAN